MESLTKIKEHRGKKKRGMGWSVLTAEEGFQRPQWIDGQSVRQEPGGVRLA